MNILVIGIDSYGHGIDVSSILSNLISIDTDISWKLVRKSSSWFHFDRTEIFKHVGLLPTPKELEGITSA